MTCFWWQLTHNITVHILRLSLKKGCLKINVEKIPTFAGCHLATHPTSGSCGSRGVGLLVFLLRVLEASQHSSGLCLFFWGGDMVFVKGEMHNEDSKRTRQTPGNERTLPRSAPANEFKLRNVIRSLRDEVQVSQNTDLRVRVVAR